MTIYKKPGKTVFASSAKVGEVLDFPDRARGWGVTIDQTNAIPPMEWFNDLQQVNDESIQYLLQYGVAVKDNETEYPVNAITNENGELYICKKQHVNKPVSNPTYWEKIRKEASKTQAGVVELSSSVTSSDETKASTSLAVKKAYDKAVSADDNANSRISKDGDTMNGFLTFADPKRTLLRFNFDEGYSAFNVDCDRRKYSMRMFSRSDVNSDIYFPKKSGVVLLSSDRSNAIDSSADTIATSLAVKKAYDKAVSADNNANSRISKDGDTMNGFLTFADPKRTLLKFNFDEGYSAFNVDCDRRKYSMRMFSRSDVNSDIYFPKKSGVVCLRDEGVPVGSIQAFASDKTQKGYLKCDGGLYSTTTYADLFAEIGYTWGGSGNKFAVPNLTDKARFLRSNGNGLKVGAYQNDAIRNIKGGKFAIDDSSIDLFGEPSGALKRTPSRFDTDTGRKPNERGGYVDFDASRVVPTADENRPYSAVVAFWIKY